MSINRTSGLIISDHFPEYEAIKKKLTYKGWDWNNQKISFNMYMDVDKNHIMIPRLYPIDDTVIDNMEEGCDIQIQSNIKPRSIRQKNAIEYLCKNNNCILKLEPGAGKTVLTIDAICKIGKKAIIFVHKDSLREGWKEEFIKHTNIKEEDIYLLKSTNYKKNIDKPIIISTVQAFIAAVKRSDFEDFLNKSKIGVAVFDECHTTVGPERFSIASYHINCKRVYGLSATPIRFDISQILNWHLGEIKHFPPEDDEILKPIIYLCSFPFRVFSKHESYLMWGGKFQYQRYYKMMKKYDDFYNVVVRLVKSAYKKDRNILILGHNIEALLNFAKKTEIQKEDIGIFIPGATDKDRLEYSDTNDLYQAFHTKQVVFSTYQACRDGNNRKNLDFLVMMTPTSNVEQAVGRICRTLSNKPIPVVLDLIDTEGPRVKSLYDENKEVGLFVKSAQKRIEIYKSLGWSYKYKNLSNYLQE